MDLWFISEFQGRWRWMASPKSGIYLETIDHVQLCSLFVSVKWCTSYNSLYF